MNDYSQYQEQKHILNYFGSKIGTFLDIGAADGIVYSNVYQLALNGWSGISVEPEMQAFLALRNNYSLFGNKSELVSAVIDAEERFVTFYENGQLSSLVSSHMENWKEHTKLHNTSWKPVTHYTVTLNRLLENYRDKKIDFISIDVEGNNHAVVFSTDWNLAPDCKLLCIEHENNHQAIVDHLEQYGFRFYEFTWCNILLERV